MAGTIIINAETEPLYPEAARLFAVLAHPTNIAKQTAAAAALTYVIGSRYGSLPAVPRTTRTHQSVSEKRAALGRKQASKQRSPALSRPKSLDQTMAWFNLELVRRRSAALAMNRIHMGTIMASSPDGQPLGLRFKLGGYLAAQAKEDADITRTGGEENISKYKDTVWVRSAPVMHIALALLIDIDGNSDRDARDLGVAKNELGGILPYLLIPTALISLITSTERVRRVIDGVAMAGIPDDSMITVLLKSVI
jgi:hypothetical protein